MTADTNLCDRQLSTGQHMRMHMNKRSAKAESKIMFVCPRPPDPQFTPRLKKLYCVFAGEKYSYSLPPKRPIVCQESGFNHTC